MRLLIEAALLAAIAIPGSAARIDPQAIAAGKEIFEGKGGCLRCHSVANRGGSLGPDLSEIGIRRTPDSLRLSITNPDEIGRASCRERV